MTFSFLRTGANASAVLGTPDAAIAGDEKTVSIPGKKREAA